MAHGDPHRLESETCVAVADRTKTRRSVAGGCGKREVRPYLHKCTISLGAGARAEDIMHKVQCSCVGVLSAGLAVLLAAFAG